MSDDRISALEAEVRELRGLLEQSLSVSAPSATEAVGPGAAESRDGGAASDEPVTRRAALRTAGVLAAGAIAGGVGMVASAAPAAAATAGPYTATNSLPALSAEGGSGKSAIKATSTNTDYGIPTVDVTGLLGVKVNAGPGVGVDAYGATGIMTTGRYCGIQAIGQLAADSGENFSVGGDFRGNPAVVANGIYNPILGGGIGVMTAGGVGALRLSGQNGPPATRTRPADQGVIDIDTNGDVWLCVAWGYPGTWRKISGPSAAGAFHAIAPVRAYDSRKSGYTLNGVIAKTTTRTVSVADSRDTSTGALVASGVVPAGATAVAANVTVTGTTGSCYFCVNPGGTTTLGASTINWFGSGQTLANGVILALDANRQVTIVAGNSVNAASAHCIIDITGYWL